jgi:hypothetical protein
VIFNDYKNRTHDKRRDFLINTVWLLVHSLAPFFAKKKSTKWIQLWTLRDFTKDVKGVLAQVGKAGFSEVETLDIH